MVPRLLQLCLTFALAPIADVSGETPTVAVDDHPDCSQGYCPSPSSTSSSSGNGDDDDTNVKNADETCNIWLGPSPIKNVEQHGFGLGMFTGRHISKGTTIESLYNGGPNNGGGGELMLPIYGSESIWEDHRPLREYVWDEDNMPEVAIEYPILETALFVPGLAAIAPCTSVNYNLELFGSGHALDSRDSVITDSGGVHRKQPHGTAGSFAYRHNVSYVAVRDIAPGEELTVQCSDDDFDGGAYYLSTYNKNDDAVVCLDQNLKVGKSKIVGAGRGLFAKRNLTKHYEDGTPIISTPMVQLKRSEMVVKTDDRDVNAQNLMLNYCYGHPNSDLLLVPYGPLVNFMNHGGSGKANAKIRWHQVKKESHTNEQLARRQEHHHSEMFDWPGDLVAVTHGKGLMIDIIATRDILEGDEILVDYGKEWEDAFEAHKVIWNSNRNHRSSSYINADDYVKRHGAEKIHTLSEQQQGAHYEYPSNMETFCYYAIHLQQQQEALSKDSTTTYYSWNDDGTHSCLRPCKVLSRYRNDEYYNIELQRKHNMRVVDRCEIDTDIIISDVPKQAIRIVNKPFTTDVLLKDAFRHEIGVPEGFYPEPWMRKKLRKSKTGHDSIILSANEFKRKKKKEEKELAALA